ncbi:MAG: phosphatase PAP2 family protein [Thermodesulfobacteriota bacterium]
MKLGYLMLTLFSFMFFLNTASAEETKAEKTQEESFPTYILRELPRNLLQDSKKSLQTLNLAILGFAIQATVVLDQSGADNEIQKEFKNSLKGYGKIGTYGGAWYTIAGITIATYVVGRLIEDKKMIDTGKALIESQIITQIATNALKFAVRRRRPDGSERTSFPSGHASATFALASTIDSLYGHKIGIPLYAFAGFVAFTRLSENKHFASDVLFGAALGTVIGRATAQVHKKGNRRFSLMPYSDGKSSGLMVVFIW